MAAKWGYLDGPLREAIVDGKRPSDVLRAIRAGTLPGVEQPAAISDRSFFERWKAANRAVGPGHEPEAGENVLARLGREIALVDELIAAGRSDEEIAEQVDWGEAAIESARRHVERESAAATPRMETP
jgi:ATP/maltotriose-dependent transcriptional regulator MalT